MNKAALDLRPATRGVEVASDHRFVFLDGIRGIAAISVAVLHAFTDFGIFDETVARLTPNNVSMAVDLFFCLSGFVIAYAYDKRLASTMGHNEFFLRRVIRLYPLLLLAVILTTALKLVALKVNPDGSAVDLLVIAAGSVIMVPFGLLVGESAFISPVMWSLFFEAIANVIYGCFFRRLNRAAIAAIMAASVIVLFVVSLNMRITSLGLGYMFWTGVIRVLYTFFAGIFLYRYFRVRAGFIKSPVLLSVALVVVLFMPDNAYTDVYQFAVVALFIPVFVSVSSAVDVGRAAPVWRFLGDLSYPLYLVHQPIVISIATVYARYGRSLNVWLVMALAIALCIVLSHAAYVIYDLPVRRWLTMRVRARRQV